MGKEEIFLTIINPSKLEKGSLPKGCFGPEGGTIGSHKDSTWRLRNYADSIADIHCEILVVRDQVCLIDRSGKTFINSAHQPLGKDVAIALQIGDKLTIGDYQIRVELPGHRLPVDDLFDANVDQLLESSRVRPYALDNLVSHNALSLKMPEDMTVDELLAPEKSIDDEDELILKDNLGVSKKEILISDQSGTNVESVSFSEQVFIPKE